ncbi:hypothetical protein T09_7540 [Trichinella sp. T9]|nr:hypothetical protein T09_7540 [Trichinella sp. T9]
MKPRAKSMKEFTTQFTNITFMTNSLKGIVPSGLTMFKYFSLESVNECALVHDVKFEGQNL